MRAMNAIDELREQGKMVWIDEEHGWIADEEHGWIAAPEDIVDALADNRFLESKRAPTTSLWGRGVGRAWPHARP